MRIDLYFLLHRSMTRLPRVSQSTVDSDRRRPASSLHRGPAAERKRRRVGLGPPTSVSAFRKLQERVVEERASYSSVVRSAMPHASIVNAMCLFVFFWKKSRVFTVSYWHALHLRTKRTLLIEPGSGPREERKYPLLLCSSPTAPRLPVLQQRLCLVPKLLSPNFTIHLSH